MSSSTIITPTPTNTNSNNNNGIVNPKTNRPLFKNIKNSNVPTTPTNTLKKNSFNVIGNGPSSNVNSSKKINNNNVVSQNNILFTPKTSMVSKQTPISSTSKSSTNKDEFLDIASIEKDLKRMEVFTGGISPSASPLKDSSPIAIVDLESVVEPINLHNTTTSSKPSVKYSVDLLLSFKSANIKRPIEIDIVENHQKEIVVPVSLPTTPYHYNNNNNSTNNSLQNTANGQKYPIFSPQISPFKVAYTQSSSTKNITPTKKSNSTFTTPQSNTHHNNTNNSNSHNNVKSSLQKKQNPIPFSLNTATPNQKTPNKKSSSTPKSNKKVNINGGGNDITSALNAAAINEDAVVPQSTDDSSVSTTTESTPKKVVLKEIDPKRLAARQRQIDIGKMTAGYKNYIALVPKSKRKPTDPKTPNKNQVCSKRSWDGQIKKWRRQLHLNYDWTGIPLPAEFEGNDSDEKADTPLEMKELDEASVVPTVEN